MFYQFYTGGMTIYTEHKTIVTPFSLIRVRGRFYPNSSSTYTKVLQDMETMKPLPKILANIAALRIKLTQNILKLYNLNASGLIISLVLGNQSILNPKFREQTCIISISYLFTLSGLNIIIITEIFTFLMRIFHIPNQLIVILTISISFFYLLFVGLNLPIQRAFLFYLLWVIGTILKISFPITKIFWFSLILSVVSYYKYVFSKLFLLKYPAVSGVIYLRGLWDNFFQHTCSNFLGNITAIIVSTSLATFSILISLFEQFNLFSLPSYILIIPFPGIPIVPSFLLDMTSFWNPTSSPSQLLHNIIYFYTDHMSYVTARSSQSIIFIPHKYLPSILLVLFFLEYYVMIKYSFFRKKGYYGRKNMEQR